MREADPSARRDEYVRLLRLCQRGSDSGAWGKSSLDSGSGRPRQRRGDQDGLLGVGGKTAQAHGDQLLKGLRHRQWIDERSIAAVARQGSCQLQREKRIPTRCGRNLGQPRPPRSRPQAPRDQVVQRRQLQRTRDEPLEPLLRERCIEPERQPFAASGTSRQQDPESCRRAPQGERQRPLGRRVEPLRVVHGNEHGLFLRERDEDAHERSTDRALVGGLIRVGLEQRDREPSLLWSREESAGLVEDAADQVG